MNKNNSKNNSIRYIVTRTHIDGPLEPPIYEIRQIIESEGVYREPMATATLGHEAALIRDALIQYTWVKEG